MDQEVFCEEVFTDKSEYNNVISHLWTVGGENLRDRKKRWLAIRD